MAHYRLTFENGEGMEARCRNSFREFARQVGAYMRSERIREHGNSEHYALHEWGLCFDYVEPHTFEDQPDGYWRFQISWGGPSEELRLHVDDRARLLRAEYVFLDWFTGAGIDVTKSKHVQWLYDNWLSASVEASVC